MFPIFRRMLKEDYEKFIRPLEQQYNNLCYKSSIEKGIWKQEWWDGKTYTCVEYDILHKDNKQVILKKRSEILYK